MDPGVAGHRAEDAARFDKMLRQFTDPFVAQEVTDRDATYVTSYANEFNLVEAHLFRKAGQLLVYVTKSPGVSVAEAQQVARQAVAQYTSHADSPAQVMYDGYSLAHSGSS